MRLCKILATLVVAFLFFSTISIGLTSSYEDDFDSDSTSLEQIFSDDLLEDIRAKDDHETIEVVIRMDPCRSDKNSLSEMDTEQTIQSLKTHSERTQARVVDSIEREDGEVLNTFWIANAVLAEVDVGSLEEISELSYVTRIHENFEVETMNSEQTWKDEMMKEIIEDKQYDTEYSGLYRDEEWEEFERRKDELDLENEIGDGIKGDLDSNSDLTWGLERINVEEVWDEGIDGSDVRVAVSDTGVDIDHPDLEGKMVNVENDEYYTGGWIEFDEDGEIVEDSTPHDTSDHGTHTSGTVVGGNYSGTNIGVAPQAELMHALVIPEGRGNFSQVLAGLEWKVEPYDREGVPLHEKYGGDVEDYRAHIASMSWGVSGYHEEIEEPIENLKNAGIVPVSSIGNDGEGSIGSPGAIYESFGIGASDYNDDIAHFSSGDIVEDGRNETPEEYVKPDFAAPGVEVKSAIPGEDWDHYSGTSMAAPHVAGTAALMLDANSNLSVDNIYKILEMTAEYFEAGDSLPDEYKNTRYGHGIIDAYQGVNGAMGNLILKRPENISRYEATLKAEVIEVPNDEMDVLFRYRKLEEEQWSETEPITVDEPREFETKIDGLEKATTYEYKAVEIQDDENETSFNMTFTTHDDVELMTLDPVNITEESALLRGEITDLYLENATVFFRYRGRNEDEWSEIELNTKNESASFEYELDLEKLKDVFICEYKAVAVSNESVFTGDIIEFPTGAAEPEWDDEKEAYLITNLGELQWIKNDLEGNYILQNDIDGIWSENWPGANGFKPIGNDTYRFNGSLDGRGFVIEEITLSSDFDESYIGLFASVGKNGTIDNLGIEGLQLPEYGGGTKIGGLIGTNHGSVNSSFVREFELIGLKKIGGLIGVNEGDVIDSYTTSGLSYAIDSGGLVGINSGKIIDSSSSAVVWASGLGRAGGLVGRNLGEVIDSHATGETKATMGETAGIGGLIGVNENEGVVNRSYATPTGRIWANSAVGGLIGINHGYVSNSFATGHASAISTVGGFVGSNHGKVSRVSASGDVEGDSNVGGLIGINRAEVQLAYFSGNVTSTRRRVGGLIGDNIENGIVSKVYTSANITAERSSRSIGGLIGGNMGEVYDAYSWSEIKNVDEMEEPAGGLIGRNGYSRTNDPGYVDRAYSITSIQNTKNRGGLVGDNQQGMINHSYWDMGRSGVYESDGGTGLTTLEMIGDNATDHMEGFDFDKVWNTIEREDENVEFDGYPILSDLESEIQIEFQKQILDTLINTIHVSEKGPDTANLRGEFIPFNQVEKVEVYFQYRESEENSWDESESKTLYDKQEFEIQIDELEPETEYEYRAVGEVEDTTLKSESLTFEIETFELNVNSTEFGNVTVPGEGSFEYAEGSEIEIEAVPQENYQFVKWIGDNQTVEDMESNLTTIELVDDLNITAEFDLEEHELEISIEGEGSIEPEEGIHIYEHGEEVTITVDPDDEWEFVEWTGDVPEGEEGEEITITIDEDKEITAVFEEEVEETPGFKSVALLLAAVIAVIIKDFKFSSCK